jgi:VanZ family protein
MPSSKWSRIIFIVWCISIVAVIYLSLIPQVELPVDFWNADKAYHCAAYAWLSGLAMLSFPVRRFALSSALFMIILGILLEIGQHFIPGRSFSVLDMAANSLGVILGIFSAKYITGRWNKK